MSKVAGGLFGRATAGLAQTHPVLARTLTGALTGATSQFLRNVMTGEAAGKDVLWMAGAGAAGGAFAGGLLGRLNTQNPVARVAVGGLAGAVVSGGMTALHLGRWDEVVIHAAVVGGISGAVDAAADYHFDSLAVQQPWRARSAGGDADDLPPVIWLPGAKQWYDPDTHRFISLADARAQGRRLVVDARPGEAVDTYEAARRSNITEEYLEGSEEIARKYEVDAAFRDVNSRLGEVASSTVPKPPGEYASPLWKTNQAGYVQNTETGQILVEVSSGKYDAFDASEVYDLQTGEIILDPSQGRVVGPDVDLYWVHGPEGPIVGETPLDRRLRGQFSEAMDERITHGQWMEYPKATGPNGPALVITRQGEFVWLEQREIAAWFVYHEIPYPRHFSK